MMIIWKVLIIFVFIAFILSIYYDNQASRTFYFIEHKGEKKILFIPRRKRMPLLIFSKEFNEFMIRGGKEDIVKMTYYVFAFFFSLAVMIMLILMLLLIKIFLNPSI